jgi:hypothetical protein
MAMHTTDGPYYSTSVETWKDASGAPQERALVRGPGLDGTIVGTTAYAEARARVQQLNIAYAYGKEAARAETQRKAAIEAQVKASRKRAAKLARAKARRKRAAKRKGTSRTVNEQRRVREGKDR